MTTQDWEMDVLLRGLSRLSAQEKVVLRHVLAGRTAKEGAREEGKSPRTFEAQRTSAYLKLGLSRTPDLLIAAIALAERGIRLSDRLH